MRIKKLTAVLLLLALSVCAALSGCTGGEDEKTKVTISPSAATVYLGETLDLTATVEGEAAVLVWSSSNEAVATVSGSNDSATVSGVAVGSATISVSIDGKVKASCAVTVEKRPATMEINLPTGKLVLDKTGNGATIKANTTGEIDRSKLVWSSDDLAVAAVEYQGEIAYVTAIAKGSCKVTVSGETEEGKKVSASCEITVLNTVEAAYVAAKTYYAFTAAGVRSEETFKGLSNAVSELVNNPAYGTGSYLATTEEPDVNAYTFNGNAYNFFTSNSVYNGFDTNSHVTNGQANWWSNFQGTSELNLFNNSEANMLQLGGGLKNSWYYRMSEIVTKSGSNDINNGWQGYRDSVYMGAGAGLNYATWADDTAYGISKAELSYDLSGSYMTPSQSEQSVYAEIYLRPIISNSDAKDKDRYYGAYFDAGTAASTAELSDGAKGYWYAFEGRMCYWHTDGTVYPLQSKITLNKETPIGYSTWNKEKGRWETDDLQIKLSAAYNFSNESAKSGNMTIDYSIVGTQNKLQNKADYTFDAGKAINRSGVRFTYGVSFTPKAKLVSEVNTYGFYNNAEVPDLNNGATWLGMKQGACVGYSYETGKVANDLSFIGTGTRQYVSIWGRDVCSYKKNAIDGTTVFDFRF